VTQTRSRRRGRRTSARPRCDPTFIGGRIAAMRDRSTRTGPDPHATTRRTATPEPRKARQAPDGGPRKESIRSGGRSRTRHGRSITTARTI
jgi:hypothetical protein